MTLPAEIAFQALTPADIGIIASTLDDLRRVGCDDATDTLALTLVIEAALPRAAAEQIAYHVIHARKRRLDA